METKRGARLRDATIDRGRACRRLRGEGRVGLRSPDKVGWQGKKSSSLPPPLPLLSSTNFIILATLLGNEIVGGGGD